MQELVCSSKEKILAAGDLVAAVSSRSCRDSRRSCSLTPEQLRVEADATSGPGEAPERIYATTWH